MYYSHSANKKQLRTTYQLFLSMDREVLIKQIESLPYWYHKIELVDGIFTPGWAPINKDAYKIPDDLSGKRVLDIGAWDGFWTFEALKRGAREVVAIDNFSDFLGTLQKGDRRAWDTFDLCRSILRYTEECCKRTEMSVYDISENKLGRFDVVFLFGTIYHLRYPLLALDLISSLCDGEIFVESAILDDYSAFQGGLERGYPGKQMLMEFYPGNQYGGNESNWWNPTLYCLTNMVYAAGFSKDIEAWKLVEKPKSLSSCRGFIHGWKR